MKFVALVVWPIFFLLTFILFRKAKLSVSSYTYSNLGLDKNYGNLFNILLITTGAIQLCFLGSVFLSQYSNFKWSSIIGLGSLVTTTIMGILTGAIPENKNGNLHLIFAKAGFIFSIIGYSLYGTFLLNQNLLIGVFMLFWGCFIMPFQIFGYWSGKGIYAKNEFFMFLGAFFTNIALIFLYF
jgi:hypothetical protein